MYKRYNKDYVQMDKLLYTKMKRKIKSRCGKKRISKKKAIEMAKTMIDEKEFNASAYYWLKTVEHYSQIRVVDEKWVVLTAYLRSKSIEY